MGYIQYGRHSLRNTFGFTNASNVFRNSTRQPLECAGTTLPSCSRIHGKVLTSSDARIVQDLLAQVERDRLRETNDRKRAGLDTADVDAESEEDYMGISSIIEKLEKGKLKETTELNRFEEQTDSDSDDEDVDAYQKKFEDFEKKFSRHEEMIQSFTDADTLDDAFKWMHKIDKFEEKHFKLRSEYRVIGELMNRLKVVTEQKDRFILQQKLNRALRLVQWEEAYDPDNPANYGLIQHEQVGPNVDTLQQSGFEKENKPAQGEEDAAAADSDDEEEFDDMKEKDNIILAKLDVIDKKLEEKLAELEYTFGRKGKAEAGTARLFRMSNSVGDGNKLHFTPDDVSDTLPVPADSNVHNSFPSIHVLESKDSGKFAAALTDPVSIFASKRTVNSLLLSELLEQLKGWMDSTSGARSIPVMHLFLQVVIYRGWTSHRQLKARRFRFRETNQMVFG
ncbi:uncharacterized protein LOC127123038 [Lathyrus oleraceus]|uniref:uncharacterized protein LOC127123038 n=1 Tax=Pisum sativum TaxID=3888 RepID=UPI0021CF64FF|nr:uncharacterized protein LOC127123038 [Pisum sativum]